MGDMRWKEWLLPPKTFHYPEQIWFYYFLQNSIFWCALSDQYSSMSHRLLSIVVASPDFNVCKQHRAHTAVGQPKAW